MAKKAAKNKAEKPGESQAKGLYRVAIAAKLADVPRQTVQRAIDAGHIPPHRTACGLPLVTLDDVAAWNEGRK